MNNYEFNTKSTYYVPPQAPKNRKILNMNKKDLSFLLVFFASIFIFIDFAVMHGFNSGFTISFFILFVVFTAYLWNKSIKVSAFSYICGILSLAGAATFTLSRDIFVNFIMVFLVTALFSIYICGISDTFRNNEGSFKMLGDLICGTIISPFTNISDVNYSLNKSISKNKRLFYVIIGFAVSVPVLLVIIPLLVSSDAAFQGLINTIARNIGIYIADAFISILFIPYVFSYAFSKKNNLKTGSEVFAKSKKSFRFSPSAVSTTFLCVISVTYLVYLFSQLAYFFSAFSGILPEGYEYTASVYARRGFFEMFAICVINIAIISLTNIATKRDGANKISKPLKAAEFFISMFSIVLLTTAMSKMSLNIEIFGLSKYRLLVSIFMVMLLVIILFFVIHIFFPKVKYMQPIIIFCSVLFIVCAFADMDSVVAKYNVNAYSNNEIETVDVSYLNNLSDSAVPYIIELANDKNEEVAQQAKNCILYRVEYDYGENFTLSENGVLECNGIGDLREFNFVKKLSNKMICDYYNSLPEDMRNIHNAYSYDEDYVYGEY